MGRLTTEERKEKWKIYRRSYRERNHEKELQRQRKWKKSNPDYDKDYYIAHRAASLERTKRNYHWQCLMLKCLTARPDVQIFLQALKREGIRLPENNDGKYRTIIKILKEADATMDAKKAIDWLGIKRYTA